VPTNTNTGWRGQAAAAGGRFARSQASSAGGRSGRGGVPNRAPNSAGRALAARNRAEVRRRRGGSGTPPTGLAKLLGGLTGGGGTMTKATAKAGRRGVGGPAGLALLAGAAGLAVKNRDKLGALLGRGGGSAEHHEHGQISSVPTEPTVVAPASPDTDATVDPATRPGPIG
jgi:hypothetical protein